MGAADDEPEELELVALEPAGVELLGLDALLADEHPAITTIRLAARTAANRRLPTIVLPHLVVSDRETISARTSAI
jgi:hypothetical protein